MWGISGSWEALRQNTETVSEQLHPRAAGELSTDTGLTQVFGNTEGRQRQTRTHNMIEDLGNWSVNKSKNLEISRQQKNPLQIIWAVPFYSTPHHSDVPGQARSHCPKQLMHQHWEARVITAPDTQLQGKTISSWPLSRPGLRAVDTPARC